jgi:hypothetical protein
VQTALAIEILLVAPIRLHDLSRLELDRHIRFARRGRQGDARLALTASKNDQLVSFDLKGESSPCCVSTSPSTCRGFARGHGAVFPGTTGPYKNEVSLRQQITKAVRKHCGIDMHPISSGILPQR